MPTDLSYLPLPVPMRTALRREITRHPSWLRYRHTHKLGNVATLPRARLLQTAADLGLDPEAQIMEYYKSSGAQFCRRVDRENAAIDRKWS